MIDGHLHWRGPDAVGSMGALAWPVGSSWFVFFLCPGCGLVVLLLGFVWFPGLWGICLVVLLVVPVCGCWILIFWFDWLFVLVCARMWVFGFCLSGVFCFGLMPLFLCFRGGAVRFSFFLGSFLTSCVFVVGLCPFGNKFLIIQKK